MTDCGEFIAQCSNQIADVVVVALANRLLAALVAPILVVAAVAARLMRPAPKRRMMLGVTPIITIREMAKAMQASGWEATTVVRNVYSIHRREDFDVVAEELVPKAVRRLRYAPLVQVLTDYRTFIWALRRFDVFFTFFDGRIMMRTPLRRLELQLLNLAGKHSIVMGYGSDVQSLAKIASNQFRERLAAEYPRTAEDDRAIEAEVAYCCRHADVVINGVDWIDFVERRDLLVAAPFFVDTDVFRPSERTRRPGPIRVGHSPNHRLIKGTDVIEAAVAQLRDEGLEVEFVVIEGVPNTEMPDLLNEIDVFAEQFIIGWYGLSAVEAMSCGVPVMAYLRPDLKALYDNTAGTVKCPVVNCAPGDLVVELRRLITDPDLRRDLGVRGRTYAIESHSTAALHRVMLRAVAAL